MVWDIVAFMLSNYAFGAYVNLVILAEILSLLLRMSQAELVNEALFWLLARLLHDALARASVSMQWRTYASKLVNFLFVVNVIENSKVFYQLLHLWREKFTACWACQDVGRPQVHQTDLAKCVTAMQNTRDLVLVVVSIVANWAIYIHTYVWLYFKL